MPVAGNGSGIGATVNWVAAGAVQVMVPATAFGFWKLIVVVVAAPARGCVGRVTVVPEVGVEVNGCGGGPAAIVIDVAETEPVSAAPLSVKLSVQVPLICAGVKAANGARNGVPVPLLGPLVK